MVVLIIGVVNFGVVGFIFLVVGWFLYDVGIIVMIMVFVMVGCFVVGIFVLWFVV